MKNLLIGVWEYAPGKSIEFYSDGYSSGITEKPYLISEGFFEILISVPSIGIDKGKVLSFNSKSITILDTSNLQTYTLIRVRHLNLTT